MAEACLLIGDLGGTNARFALADATGSGFTGELTVRCSDYQTAEVAIAAYLEQIDSPQPEVICLAAAGPVIDNSIRFINNHWSIDGRELGKNYPSAKIHLLNDFEAIAYSLPVLGEPDLMTIGLESPAIRQQSNYTIGVLGSGTGLGEAGLISQNGKTLPVVGEGSHSGFAPENRLQLLVLEQIRKRFERVSDERLLAGSGIENIYQALCIIRQAQGTRLSAVDIFKRARANEDNVAIEALQLFYEILGQVAGNLALTLGAWDGIYIAGGIVKRYPDSLKTSNFRSGFENKGRYRSMMEKVPTTLIMHSQPGLLGASYCARQLYSA